MKQQETLLDGDAVDNTIRKILDSLDGTNALVAATAIKLIYDDAMQIFGIEIRAVSQTPESSEMN